MGSTDTQNQYIFAICTRLNNKTLLFYIEIAIFGGNLGNFQNDVEAKPLEFCGLQLLPKTGYWVGITSGKIELVRI